MSDLYRRLLAELDRMDWEHGTADCFAPARCVHRANLVLRKLAERHHPVPWGAPESPLPPWRCAGCEPLDWVTHPCPELITVAAALDLGV